MSEPCDVIRVEKLHKEVKIDDDTFDPKSATL